MSALLSKIKWQVELINIFKLRKMLKTKRKNKQRMMLKVSGILGVLLLILINKQTKHPEAK